MKISNIPNLGRFGIFIDDIDFENLSDEEWMEIGKLHINSLVTIIRNANCNFTQYENRMHQWGHPRSNESIRLCKKYGISLNKMSELITSSKIEEHDKQYFDNLLNCIAIDITGNPSTTLIKVSGKKKSDGTPLGMFAEGELLWHSNESGNLLFSPGVGLLGVSGTKNSATGFCTTVDWYEEQSESFRTELNDMILEHTFTPGRINPGLREEQDGIMHRNMCPEPIELPIVAQSPGGLTGIHYSINTIKSIKGATADESKKIFDYINKTLFVEKFIYDYWYNYDNDLLIFDNSITLHRRLGGIADRMALRFQFVYDKLVNPEWCPWLKEPFTSAHSKLLREYKVIMEKNDTSGY